ncbi:MAG: ATP-binding protein [Bacilli bacterium]|nr:ATP-binding protein [Bacilli bacterium]
MDKPYIPRLFDEQLSFALKCKGAVVVTGPKWCGKSTTSRRHAKTVIDLMPIETRDNYVAYAKTAPHSFLTNCEHPLLIDEWQHVSFLWDQIKFEVDERREFGGYLLTGSVTDHVETTQSEEASEHTGNGRFDILRMRTLSLYESGEGSGNVSLSQLAAHRFSPCLCDLTIEDYAYLICRGGWPLSVLAKEREVALEQAFSYVRVLTEKDVFSLNAIKLAKNPQRAGRILRAYARHISTPAADETIFEDAKGSAGTLDNETIRRYLNAYRLLFVVDELESWSPYLRSKTAIRCKPTRHFVDPSIATAAMGLSPESLFTDMATFGLLFESLAIRDLRVYMESLRGKVYKYRDAKNREADAVLTFRDGSFALAEIKLGSKEDIDKAAQHLISLSLDIDHAKTGKLAFMMVVTKDRFAYRREDGVYVVPLGCLRN